MIEIDPSAETKTLIHEIAHELLHKGNGRHLPPGIYELEAEAVAYVVARNFGLDSLQRSNYVALDGASSVEIMEHLERIRNAAGEMITAIELNGYPTDIPVHEIYKNIELSC